MLTPGDRVAVFTGRDYTTVANHGIVLVPHNDFQNRTLVFLPHQNSYCLADDESMLRCDQIQHNRVPFAEIVFETRDADNWSGTYQRLNECKNTFEFLRSPNDRFGFELRAEIVEDGMHLGESHLEIRLPRNVEFKSDGCLNVLRQILGLEYTKHVVPKTDDAG